MRREYKVYLIKCSKTEDIKYVGMTRTSLAKRFNSHICKFKINRCDYYIELVLDNLDNIQAAALEKKLIKQYDVLAKGWNKSPGSINGCSNYHSNAQKAKGSSTRKWKPVHPKHAELNRIARLGKNNTDSHNKAISKANSKPVLCFNNGITYRSAREAAKQLDLQYSKISLVCNGLRPHTKGYKFIFVEKQ